MGFELLLVKNRRELPRQIGNQRKFRCFLGATSTGLVQPCEPAGTAGGYTSPPIEQKGTTVRQSWIVFLSLLKASLSCFPLALLFLIVLELGGFCEQSGFVKIALKVDTSRAHTQASLYIRTSQKSNDFFSTIATATKIKAECHCSIEALEMEQSFVLDIVGLCGCDASPRLPCSI